MVTQSDFWRFVGLPVEAGLDRTTELQCLPCPDGALCDETSVGITAQTIKPWVAQRISLSLFRQGVRSVCVVFKRNELLSGKQSYVRGPTWQFEH